MFKHVLSCFVKVKHVLLISCVYWIFFQNAGSQLCFRFFARLTVKASKSDLITPILHSSAGCQCLQDYHTKYSPSITVLCQVLVLNTCPKSCKFIHHLDNSIPPVTITFFVCPLSKQKPLVKLKDPFHMQALPSGTNFHMTSEIQSKTSFRKALKTCLFAVHY